MVDDEAALLLNSPGLPSPGAAKTDTRMAAGTSSATCAAHNCLKPRFRDGWCAAHWYAHRALVLLQAEAEDKPESLAICEAIWNAC